jgi:hypothetical protein
MSTGAMCVSRISTLQRRQQNMQSVTQGLTSDDASVAVNLIVLSE